MYVLLSHVEIPKMMLILKDKIYYDGFKDAFYRLHARNHANAMEQTKHTYDAMFLMYVS